MGIGPKPSRQVRPRDQENSASSTYTNISCAKMSGSSAYTVRQNHPQYSMIANCTAA